LLAGDLGADVNIKLKKAADSEYAYFPLHLAIWHDFQR
jgi:hypothetical protein